METPDPKDKIEKETNTQPKKRGRKKKIKVVESKIRLIEGNIVVHFD